MRVARATSCGVGCVLLLLLLVSPARSQCDYGLEPEIGQRGVGGPPGAGVFAITSWDPDGAGPAGPLVVVGGLFTSAGVPARNVARFDGNAWTPLASGLSSQVYAMLKLPSGDLIVGGPNMQTVDGSAAGIGVLRWDGAAWSALTPALQPSVSYVSALAGTPDGGFVAGGDFKSTIDPNLNDVARWSTQGGPGGSWSSLDAGTSGISPSSKVRALAVLPGGDVVAAGDLRWTGSVVYSARFDATSWSEMDPGPIESDVFALAVLPEGTLVSGTRWRSGFVGGCNSVVPLSEWTGSTWEPIGWACSNVIRALAVTADGRLQVGGVFDTFAHYLFGPQDEVVWSLSYAVGGLMGLEPCAATGTAYCSGDGSATPCPCGNAGATGRGCENSATTGGAGLSARGRARVSNDSVTLDAVGLPLTTPALLFQGTLEVAGGAGSVFGDGLRCAGGAVVRLAVRNAQGGAFSFGDDVPGDPPVSSAGAVSPAGATHTYQVWYRDPVPFCTNDAWNLSQGLSIAWAP